jgi:hypothetical protein
MPRSDARINIVSGGHAVCLTCSTRLAERRHLRLVRIQPGSTLDDRLHDLDGRRQSGDPPILAHFIRRAWPRRRLLTQIA